MIYQYHEWMRRSLPYSSSCVEQYLLLFSPCYTLGEDMGVLMGTVLGNSEWLGNPKM